MEEEIKKCIKILRGGGVILYPTDTVWGLGCDATNPSAVNRIYEIKHRNESKSMICLVSGIAQLERYVEDIPEIAYELIDASIKPLTIVYSHPVGIACNAMATDGSVGIRITEEKFSNALCRRLQKPIISTSANVSGTETPANFSLIDKSIISAVDYVVSYRQNDTSKPSPSDIIKLDDGGLIKVIR